MDFLIVKMAFVLAFLFVNGIVCLNNNLCPFDFLYHMGDGAFDIGNSIRRPYGRTLPAAKLPYGVTNPGYPTGRWCDGILDIDIGANAMGFPILTPYLGLRGNANAIIFAVAYSPILDIKFFETRGVRFPKFAASLGTQMKWLRGYLKNACSCLTRKDCTNLVGNSLFLFGDVEANDLAIPLMQGKSIQQVRSYVESVTNAQITAARDLIRLGGKRIILPGNVPIGCYPFMLTKFYTNNSKAYDDFGCLRAVNELIKYKNDNLQKAIARLKNEFPHTLIFYADFYSAYIQLLQETLAGPNKNQAFQACCGIGGAYKYNPLRFCGSAGVKTCSNPRSYIHWDGIHLTEEANNRLSILLQVGALEKLNCTKAPSPNSKNLIRQVVSGAGEVKRKEDQEVPLVLSAELELGDMESDLTNDSPVKSATGFVFDLETADVEAAIAQSVDAGAIAEGEIADGEGALAA